MEIFNTKWIQILFIFAFILNNFLVNSKKKSGNPAETTILNEKPGGSGTNLTDNKKNSTHLIESINSTSSGGEMGKGPSINLTENGNSTSLIEKESVSSSLEIGNSTSTNSIVKENSTTNLTVTGNKTNLIDTNSLTPALDKEISTNLTEIGNSISASPTTTEKGNSTNLGDSSCPSDQSKSMVYHKETSKCYEIGTKGPCPNNLLLFSIASHGECDCPQPGDSNQVKIPHVYHPPTDKCYPIYSKAYCNDSQWLIFTDVKTIKCTRNPCLAMKKDHPVLMGGGCIGLNTICSAKGAKIEKVIGFHKGQLMPSCDGGYQNDKISGGTSAGTPKCGRGKIMNTSGQCQNIQF